VSGSLGEESPVSSTAVVVIIVIVLVAVVLGGLLARRRRSTQLQEHFGPEYERSVSAASGDRRAAEAELIERRHRREEFDIRDLRPEERDRFRESWNEIQRGFVDDPRQSLRSADLLVAEIMRARGYPVDDDFDRRADDLSVDHPRVVQHYREARRVRDADGEVDTEHQRTAVTSYRALVDALLGDDEAHVSESGPASRTSDRAAADAPATGRHALREPDGPHDDPPADPNGPQSPRTEERTR
jgi:FtsZ-interacting cell division protein ZipA